MQGMTSNTVKQIRTRIAPSPTGYPHIGTIYQALFDFAYAKHFDGKFIVRIEDTDRVRFVEDAESKLFASLDWFGFSEDESPRKGGAYEPYRQSERLETYKKAAEHLLESGHAYYCFCTKERLDEVRMLQQKEKKPTMYDKHCRFLSKEEVKTLLTTNTSPVIRLAVPEHETIICPDGIRGDVSFDSSGVDDQVLIKADGFPTYHLAVVVDDHAMEISHVVRGEDWIPSFPKQVLLYRFFGWELPLFYHTSNLRNPDKTKMSKRHGHTNVEWYKENGYLPEAILNYIALLGWSHPMQKEIFSVEEFISQFDLKDISAVGPVFDLVKLTWMNGMYIRSMSVDVLAKMLITRYPQFESLGKEKFHEVVSLAQSRIETLNEFEPLAQHFLQFSKLDLSESEQEVSKLLVEKLHYVTTWDTDHIFPMMKELLVAKKIRMPILYKILTGVEKGMPLPETVVLLGREETLRRLEHTA